MTTTDTWELDTGLARTPPHDLPAERGTLGAMMLSAGAIADVAPILGPADHYSPAHRSIHEAILSLDAAGQPVDWVTVADALAKQGELALVGGPAALHDCVQAAGAGVFAAHHARIVRDKAILRRQIEVGARIIQLAYTGKGEAADLAERARQEVDTILPPVTTGGVQDIGDLFADVIDSLETAAPRGLPVPWTDVNRLIPGLAPGELIVVGASSGTGKSIAGLNIAAHAAIRCGVQAAVFTMEMTRHEVMLRLIASEARVPLDSLTHRNVGEEYWDRIRAVRERIISAPLLIDDSPAMSVATIRSRLRELARSHPAGVAFVDYLALLREPDGAENRQNAVAANARALKHIAGEFSIPVLAAAQLNRQMEHRSDKRPQPSDLRDSAEIEHAASAIILLHREDVHGEETPRAGEIDFIVGKNRNGPTGTVTLCFQGAYARCVDFASNWTAHSVIERQK